GQPSKRLKVVLVFGQDGAVGTVAYLSAILRAAGERVGVLTGQFIEIAGERVQGSDKAEVVSDSNRVQALLAQMKRAGCTYALIEIPSDLPDHQFAGIGIHMLIIRRCGDNYVDQTAAAAGLARLNGLLARRPQFVVYNRDDPVAEGLDWLRGQDGAISFGVHRRAECRMEQVRLHALGSQVSLVIDHQTPLTLVTEQAGKQAAYNMAAAAAAGYVLHVPVEAIERGCRTGEAIASQLQVVPIARPYMVLVDSALTPEGLMEILEVAKHFSKNRLIVVYGAPQGVRPAWLPAIGDLLVAQADRIIVTDGEYTSHQSPKQIREHIWQGITAAGGEAKTEEVEDRKTAIEKTVSIARRGDVVLVAASTLRPYRQLGSEHLPWSDLKIINDLFEA
ncbi:MAG TPA: Mur ligase family protein, partial [Magnetospirillaceae bacterium]|nr:Mur ligase family protein [Magnetospirillaceae bacterium]